MTKYKVVIEEVLRWYVEVDAKDEETAYNLANDYAGMSDPLPEDCISVRSTTTNWETLSIEEITE